MYYTTRPEMVVQYDVDDEGLSTDRLVELVNDFFEVGYTFALHCDHYHLASVLLESKNYIEYGGCIHTFSV
jgi:hypothetical protein